MKQVEQIDKNGNVVLSKDSIFSSKETYDLLSKLFTNLEKNKTNYFFTIKGKKYSLFVKNITYLGHPHPVYKKRIQVPSAWGNDLTKNTSFLMGIYHYKDNVIFALFSKKRRGKSSSAHISTIDIVQAVESGVFKKTDKNDNEIIVFTSENINKVFDSVIKDIKISNNEEIEVLNVFSENLGGKWNGINAYTEMIDSKFSQALQSEWPGFYFEYKFDNFLKLHKEYLKICTYIRDKGNKDLDFDIKFAKNFFGDLKTHDVKSSSILGNDKDSFMRTIKQHGKLWYVVLELEATKDRNHGFIVSKFWRQKCIEIRGVDKKEGSYAGRMKSSVAPIQFTVLEINKFNKKYVSDFKQPKNSNGKERELKIQIKKRDIDNFVIFRKTIVK